MYKLSLFFRLATFDNIGRSWGRWRTRAGGIGQEMQGKYKDEQNGAVGEHNGQDFAKPPKG